MEPEQASFVFKRDHTGLKICQKSPSYIQLDTLLSWQHVENFRSESDREPEKMLMVAILEDAVSCYQSNLLSRDKWRRRLFKEAEEWISGAPSDWIFCFENVCETLGLDPEYVRQGLFRWKNRIGRAEQWPILPHNEVSPAESSMTRLQNAKIGT